MMPKVEAMKKSQSSLMILVGIISVILVTWAIMSFSQISMTRSSLKELAILKLSEYVDYFKGYTRNSVILSSHISTKLISQFGGLVTTDGLPRSWICTAPTPPSVDEVRYYLSLETVDDLNQYTKNMKETIQSEPVNLFTGKFSCSDYDVNENSVKSGQNDESFNVGAYGSYMTFSNGQDIINATNDVYEPVARVRFWYLYRNFKQWAEENSFAGYMCACMFQICGCEKGMCDSSCSGFNQCYKEAANKALQDLQSKFDNYVTCHVTPECCYEEKKHCGDAGANGCVGWSDAPECNRCYLGSPEQLCSNNPSTFSASTETSSSNSQTMNDKQLNYFQTLIDSKSSIGTVSFAAIGLPYECSTKKCELWDEVRGSVQTEFSCEDQKYVLSTQGKKYLNFQVDTSIALASRQCYYSSPCQCSTWECSVDETVDPDTGQKSCPPGKEVCTACGCTENLDWCLRCQNDNIQPPKQCIPTPGTKLGIQYIWQPSHVMDFIQATKPAVVKIMSDYAKASEIKQLSPGTFVIGRVIDDQNQPMDGDPAQRAQEWFNNRLGDIMSSNDIDCWEGYNEPGAETPAIMSWFAKFEIKRMQLLDSVGRKACIGSFTMGYPANFDLWNDFKPAVTYATTHGHYLALHEYDGPRMDSHVDHSDDSGWLTLRYRKVYRKFNFKLPLLITESGIATGPYGGWKTVTTADDYAKQLEWYDSEMRKDSYVIGAAIFAYELPNWENFNIYPDLTGADGTSGPLSKYMSSNSADCPIAPPPITPTPTCKNGKNLEIVLYGDSITDQQNANGNPLQQELNKISGGGCTYTVDIAGFPAQVAYIPETKQPRDIDSEVINKYHPNIVILWWGMNSCDSADCYNAHNNAYKVFISKLKAKGITPVILTTNPVCSEPYYKNTATGATDACIGIGYHSPSYNSNLQDHWGQETQVNMDRALAVPIIDIRKEMQSRINVNDPNCCSEFWSYQAKDGVHPSQNGHQEIMKFVASQLVSQHII